MVRAEALEAQHELEPLLARGEAREGRALLRGQGVLKQRGFFGFFCGLFFARNFLGANALLLLPTGAGIVNESQTLLASRKREEKPYFPYCKDSKTPKREKWNLKLSGTSPASAGRPGGRSPFSSGKTSWRPFPLLLLFPPLRSRGISSSRHRRRRRRIEGSLLLPLFYSTYLEKNGRRKKGLGGIVIHSYTRILSFPHFLYPLYRPTEKYRPSQQGSSPLPPADDQSIMHAPPYVHTFCLFDRTAQTQ